MHTFQTSYYSIVSYYVSYRNTSHIVISSKLSIMTVIVALSSALVMWLTSPEEDAETRHFSHLLGIFRKQDASILSNIDPAL